MTKPENFLKSSSELNFVLRSITRSQVFLWAGPAWMTASSTRHTEVFILPKDVMTSSCTAIMLRQAFLSGTQRINCDKSLLEKLLFAAFFILSWGASVIQ